MSYSDAKADGIEIRRDKNDFNWYYPPCHICGKEIPSWGYIRNTKYTCPECRKELVKLEYKKRQEEQIPKKERKFETAVKRIKKVADIRDYEYAIGLIKPLLSKPGWFQSTEEIMVALELARRKIQFYHQVKIYNYCVDFVIPKFKIVLEIDGELFHRKDNKEKSDLRDELLKDKLGNGYDVIHIKTNCINMDVTRLLAGINAVKKYRKRKECTSIH